MGSPSRCPCKPGSYYEPQIRKEARRRELACPRSHWKTGRTTRNRVSLFCTWTRRFQEPQNSPILVSKTSFSLLSAHHPLCHAHFCRKKLLQEHPSHSPCNIFPKLNSKISFSFFFCRFTVCPLLNFPGLELLSNAVVLAPSTLAGMLTPHGHPVPTRNIPPKPPHCGMNKLSCWIILSPHHYLLGRRSEEIPVSHVPPDL